MITLRRLGRTPREAIAGALIALPVFSTVELSRIRGRRKLVTGMICFAAEREGKD